MSTVSTLITRIQALLEDPSGEWADTAYLRPFILQANEDLNTKLESINLTYGEKVVTVSNIPANTSDLSSYMAAGQPLEDLEMPISVEWRIPGEADNEWKPVTPKDKLTDEVSADTVKSWEWRGEALYVSNCTQAFDLRIRYDALTVDVSDPNDDLLRGVCNVLAYRTAELVAGPRGGTAASGEPLAKWLNDKGNDAEEDFIVLAVKRNQRIRRKFGRMNESRRFPNWGVPFGS